MTGVKDDEDGEDDLNVVNEFLSGINLEEPDQNEKDNINQNENVGMNLFAQRKKVYKYQELNTSTAKPDVKGSKRPSLTFFSKRRKTPEISSSVSDGSSTTPDLETSTTQEHLAAKSVVKGSKRSYLALYSKKRKTPEISRSVSDGSSTTPDLETSTAQEPLAAKSDVKGSKRSYLALYSKRRKTPEISRLVSDGSSTT